MKIGLTGLYVDDQDKAKEFYTGVLGMKVHTDFGDGTIGRWLSIVSPDAPDGIQVTLHPATEAARAFQEANRSGGQPVLSFTTDDCQREYERLRALGVTFTMPPTTFDYGGTDAVFEDGCGNLLNLHQA